MHMKTPRVYIVNLGSYNRGQARGKWYDLPVDYRRVQRELQLDEAHGEEYAIHAFENFYGFSVSEYSSIKELNAYAQQLEEVSHMDHIEDILEVYTLKEVLELGDNFDFVQADDEEDLAYEVVEQMGGLESFEPSTLELYFDYAAYGRDLALRGYRQSSNGYVRKLGR